jgi:hypothetical protein
MEYETTKTVKLPRSKADEWDEYVTDNPEIDSISHLIRLSVQRQMNGGYNQPQSASIERSDAPASAEVMATLRDIQRAIGGLDDRLSAIERVESSESSFSLERAIYSFLPETGWYSGYSAEEYDSDEDVFSSRELANKLGADVSEVEATLRKMSKENGQIQIEEMEDGRIYAAKEFK